MPTFQDFQQAVAHRIQDTATKLLQPAVDGCIKKAIKGRYAQARPLIRIKDFAGDGVVFEYTVDSTNFPDWVDGASFFRRLEYPAGEKVPVYLSTDDWIYPVLISSTVKKLRLLTTVPATGKTLRVEYSVPHKEDASTVPAVDFEGAADLAASCACVELAAIYSQTADQSYAGGMMEHHSKASDYLRLAKVYEGKFEGAFGLDGETKQPAATEWASWPTDTLEGDNRQTH